MSYGLNTLPRPKLNTRYSNLQKDLDKQKLLATNNWILSQIENIPDDLLGTDISDGNDNTNNSNNNSNSSYYTVIRTTNFEELYQNLRSLNHTTTKLSDYHFVRHYRFGDNKVITVDVNLETPNLAISKIYGDIGTDKKLVRKIVFNDDCPESTEYYQED